MKLGKRMKKAAAMLCSAAMLWTAVGMPMPQALLTAQAEDTAPSLRLTATLTEGFPYGITELHLYAEGNPGLEALGIALTLPDILKPDADANGAVKFHATDALRDTVYSYYTPETHKLSLAYASDEAGAPVEELGYFSLYISPDAVIREAYPIQMELDSIYADGIQAAECEAETVFTPTEPLLRTLSATELTLTEQGGGVTLTLSPEPPAGSCLWISNSPKVVKVDKNGNLTALANGKAVITVICETRTYDCNVTVRIDRQLAQSRLTVDSLGGTVQLALVPEPANAVTWHSEDEAVVSVTENGLASVHACGTAEIVAFVENTEYRFSVETVITRALNHTEYTIKDMDETVQLVLSPESHSAIMWSTDNPDVAAVSDDGLVTPVRNGTATITASCEGYDFTCAVTVEIPVRLNLESYTARSAGETVQLALIPPPDESEPPVWTSSDPAVASVDENGLVTFLADGIAEITAEYLGERYVCAVTLQRYLRGDVNGNGRVEAQDALLALIAYANAVSGLDTGLSPVQQLAADVNEDGAVRLNDAVAILNYYTAGVSKLPQNWDDLI